MKKEVLLLSSLFIAINVAFSQTTTIITEGFESSTFPSGFSKTGNTTWNQGGVNDYTGSFWDNLYTTSSSTQTSSISTTEHHGGSQSLKLTITTAAQLLSPKFRSKDYSLTTSGQTISDWGNFTITMYVKVLKPDGSSFGSGVSKKIFSTHNTSATDTWQLFTFNSTTSQYSSGLSATKLFITLADLGEDYVVYIDDVTVTKTDNVWTGATNNAWNNVGNWSDGTKPGTGRNVYIPSGTTRACTVTTAATTNPCNNLTIVSGATLTINSTASFAMNGVVTNNGTFTDNSGSTVINNTSTFTNNGTFNANAALTNNGTFTNNATITTTGTFSNTSGSTYQSTGGTMSGSGSFVLASGATLSTDAATGLNSTNGPIRCTTRNFSTGANYIFAGSAAQVTGSELPTNVNNLTFNNSTGVTLSGSVNINGNLTLTSGLLTTSPYSLKLYGNASGAGSVDMIYFLGSSEQTFSSILTTETVVEANSKLTNSGTMNGSLTLNSNGTGTGTFINNGSTNFTYITAYQDINSTRNWYISSPVLSSGYSLSPMQNIDLYYEYDETGNNSNLVVNGSTAYWRGYNSAFAMVPGKGYIAHSIASGTLAFVGYNGLNDNASYSIPLTRTSTATKPGFNLVGNPYPAYLNWSAVIADAGNANISTTMWYKTKNTGNAYTFATHNGTSGITVSGTANTTITQYIPPMQGFWVRVNDGTSSTNLTVSKSMLSHRDVTGNTLKAKEVTSNTILRLKVSNGTNEDENVLYFNSNASNSLDNYDSPKMSNNNADIPEIYTLADNEKLVINGMQSIPYNTEIPLGFVTGTDGTNFSIKASEISGFDSDVQIALIDQTAQTQTILNGTNSYDFASGISSGTGRFSVMFKTASGITSTTVVGEEQPVIYQTATGETAVNLAALSKGGFIRLFNAQGQQLIQMTTTKSTTLLPKQLTKGVYIVSTQVDNKTFQQKIVIK